MLVLICTYIFTFCCFFVFSQNAFCPDVIVMVDWMLKNSYLCICWWKIVSVWFFVVQMTHYLMKTMHDEKLCLLGFLLCRWLTTWWRLCMMKNCLLAGCCSDDSWPDEDCAPWKTVVVFCYSDDAWPDEDHAWSRRNSADKIQHRAAVYSWQRCVTLCHLFSLTHLAPDQPLPFRYKIPCEGK